MKHSPAYTLIEILIGLTIIGLIFSFGYVSFREFSRRQALIGAVKELKGDLRLAQSQALSGQNEGCTSPLDGYLFTIINNSNYQISPSCTGSVEVKTVSLASDTTISSTAGSILFKVLGQGTSIAQGSSVTLTLTQAGTGETATVTVGSGGEIK